MKGPKIDYSRIADRFRYFAEVCRQYAERDPSTENEWLAKAEQWERDAKQVEQDGQLIAESRAMLGQIEARLERREKGERDNGAPVFVSDP